MLTLGYLEKTWVTDFTESSLFSLVSIISYRYSHFHCIFIIDFDQKPTKNQSLGKMQALKLPKAELKTINHSIRKNQ